MDSTEVRRYWAERAGEYSPEYYAHHGPNQTSRVLFRILDQRIDREMPVLELGCSAGRHLAYLHEQGFEDLSGIEVNPSAAEVMEATYPDLAAAGSFSFEAMEDVVGSFDDDQFGAVYSVETLQHLHPDAAWVFEELSRITRDVLVTAENEGDREETADGVQPADPAVNYINDEFPLYYRDWKQVFTNRGFTQLETDEVRRNTVRVFRPTGNGTSSS